MREKARKTAEAGTSMERIIEAARTCFERYGIQKTTIEDIAKSAGVSRPTVYKHFPGKQQIVEHISLAEMAKVQDTLRARMPRQTSFADTVTEAVLLSVEVAAQNPYVRAFVQDVELSAQSQEPGSLFQVEARARWTHVMERARASGELAGDIDMDQIVAWLSLSQMMLVTTGDRLGIGEDDLRHFIRRFVVEPLLTDRGN